MSEKKSETTVKLKYPISFGEEKITEIVLKRPKGRHVKTIGKDVTLKDLLDIASSVSGHPPSVFDDMDAEDVFAVSGAIGNFLDSGQGTGVTE